MLLMEKEMIEGDLAIASTSQLLMLLVDLPRLFMSHDPEEWISLLRDRCLPDLVIDNDVLRARGRKNIGRIIHFATRISKESGIKGDPIWNDKEQTISYEYYRKLKFGRTSDEKAVLHLVHDASGGWKITGIGDRHINMTWTMTPIIGSLYYHVWRPVFSWFTILLGVILGANQHVRRIDGPSENRAR